MTKEGKTFGRWWGKEDEETLEGTGGESSGRFVGGTRVKSYQRRMSKDDIDEAPDCLLFVRRREWRWPLVTPILLGTSVVERAAFGEC